MVVGGCWEENELTIVVRDIHWEFVLNLLRKDGYELEPPNDTLAEHEDAVWEKMFLKGDKVVWVKVFDAEETTRESVAVAQPFTASMSILTPTGIIIPFPELTLSRLAAVRRGVNDDTDLIRETAAWLTSIGMLPLVIGNRIITTRELQRVSRAATTILEQRITWHVEWKPSNN